MITKTSYLLIICLVISVNSVHNILDYGAIPHKDTIEAQNINSKAI